MKIKEINCIAETKDEQEQCDEKCELCAFAQIIKRDLDAEDKGLEEWRRQNN